MGREYILRLRMEKIFLRRLDKSRSLLSVKTAGALIMRQLNAIKLKDSHIKERGSLRLNGNQEKWQLIMARILRTMKLDSKDNLL